jgi:hypothetical protein
MVYDPEEADIFSLSEYISVAFYSGKGISPLDWDFEAQFLQLSLTAYYLAVYA